MMRYLSILIATSLFLTSCGGKESVPFDPAKTSGARSGVLTLVQAIEKQTVSSRPSAVMGLLTAHYLSRNVGIPVSTAAQSVLSHLKIIEGQENPQSEETFSLLRDLGSVLQEDINLLLNSSSNRAHALNQYVQSLTNVVDPAMRKHTELKERVEDLKEDKKEMQKKNKELKERINEAFDSGDYRTASDLQMQQIEVEKDLAAIDLEGKQTKDMRDRFDDLLDIADKRAKAIENNREILIAGLKVVDVPGVEDLSILEGEREERRERVRSLIPFQRNF